MLGVFVDQFGGLGRRLSRFLSSALGWISAAWASGVSSIVLCRGIVRGDVTGRGALVHPGKQAATARKWFISYFLNCSRCQTKGFSHPIHVTTKCYSSYQQYYNYYPHYQSCWRNWPGESIVCFYHGRSLVQEGVIHGSQRSYLSNEGSSLLFKTSFLS